MIAIYAYYNIFHGKISTKYAYLNHYMIIFFVAIKISLFDKHYIYRLYYVYNS